MDLFQANRAVALATILGLAIAIALHLALPLDRLAAEPSGSIRPRPSTAKRLTS